MDCQQLLTAFRSAAAEVPAYRTILAEAGIDPAEVRTLGDFETRVPVIDKAATFGRFPIDRLCRDGRLGDICGVLTSSGHSGRFSFGIYAPADAARETQEVDDALDRLFQVRSKRTLLVNCLPMGVAVPTHACTLGQTSVRADMAVGQVAQFGPHFEQVILVADAAFLKHVLELGIRQGVRWDQFLVHCVVGEEPLAENARTYLGGLLGCDLGQPETGLVLSSMGVAELGLNLFWETPELIHLRRRLHQDPKFRRSVLGDEGSSALPMVFTYDPARIHVEVMAEGGLVLSTLDPSRRIPLIRYATGDRASWVRLDGLGRALPSKFRRETPLLLVHGRGKGLMTPQGTVSPEQVKEGLYARAELAERTTANFRLTLRGDCPTVRIQLAPGVSPGENLREQFREALTQYVAIPFTVEVQAYESFGSGMGLDYERKFDYLGP